MLLLLIKVTGLLLAATFGALLMRRTSAGARHLVWLVALAALLVLPALAAWAPLQLHVLPAALSRAEQFIPTTAGTGSTGSSLGVPGDTPAAPIAGAPTPQAAPPTAANISWSALLVSTWLAVLVVLLAWLIQGWLAVRRIVRRAQPLDQPEWNTPLLEIADRLGLDQAPRLMRSADVHMPFAAGVWQATIVLPMESTGWSADQRTAVLIHELGHVRRHDLLGHTLGRIACALYWFHPLVWTAARRLRDESERACDDLALQFGARPSEYAEHLLTIVTAVRHHRTPSVALAMAHRKEFEGRMLAILDPQLRRTGPSRRQTLATVGSLALLCLAIGAATPAPRDAGTPLMQVKSDSTMHDLPTTALDPRPDEKPVAHITINPRVDSRRDAEISKAALKAMSTLPTAVAQARDDERPALLAKLLRTDSSAQVRRVAAWGLMQYVSQSVATDALNQALRSDSDERVRQMAAWALGDGDKPASTSALIDAMQHDKSEIVREVAVWAVAEQDIAGGAAAIGQLLQSERSWLVRGTAAWALGNLDVKTAPKGLIDALSDTNADVRYKASWALSEIGDKAALPALRKALSTEQHPGAIRAQLRAIVNAGEEPTELAKLLTSSLPEVRSAAARALAGGGNGGPWPWPWPRPIPNP